MTTKIKKIKIEAFRGIPELELQLNNNNLLLLGENGTGKSSIVDALELFFKGEVEHLEGVQGLSTIKHAPHINFNKEDVSIELTFSPGPHKIQRTLTCISPIPEAIEEYFETANTGTFILKRNTILEFINSKPAEKFRAVGKIMGIDDLDEIELELMRTKEIIESKFDTVESSLKNRL